MDSQAYSDMFTKISTVGISNGSKKLSIRETLLKFTKKFSKMEGRVGFLVVADKNIHKNLVSKSMVRSG